MKKNILLIFLLSNIYLFGNENTTTADEAYKNYTSKNYQEAYRLYNDIYTPTFVVFKKDFYYARSAFELKKYKLALEIYNKLLDASDTYKKTRVELEIARIYFIQKKYDESKKIFTKLYSKNIPTNVKYNIKQYVDAINKKQKENNIYGYVLFGLEYDSNLNNRSDEDTIYIPSIDSNAKLTTEKTSEVLHKEVVSFNYKHKMKNNNSLNHQLFVINKSGIDKDEQDYSFVQYAPSLDFKYDRYIQKNKLFIDQLWYQSKKYVKTYGFSPSIEYFTKDFYTRVGLKYQKKDFLQEIDKNKNSDVLNLQLDYRLFHNVNSSTMFSFIYTKENKEEGDLTNIDAKSLKAGVYYLYKINKPYTINLSLSYKKKDYELYDSIYNKKREDKKSIVSFTNIYQFDKDLFLHQNNTYEKNKSNMEIYTYDKYIIGFNILKRFSL